MADEQQAAAALGADQRLGQLTPVLGQQVFQRVAGDLPAEPAELGAHAREMPVGERRQFGDGVERRCPAAGVRPVPSIISSERTFSAVRPQATARGPQALLPIIPPRVQRAWLDGSGPNRRPCGAARACRFGQHDAGLHPGRPCVRVELQDPIQMTAEVDHQAGADGVPGDRGAAPAGRDADTRLPGDVDNNPNVIDGFGENDRRRHHPVVRCVRGILRAASVAVIHPAGQPRPQQADSGSGGGFDAANVAVHHPTLASRTRTGAPVVCQLT